ncbi:MAG TPA: DUF1801 domain-containing protein [Rectinemataceae bacterium]|nr:DUF1801 domain-containing protein [Rectinemataceae bacterium]
MDYAELLSRLAAPARRALETLGLDTIKDLARHDRGEIADLHGMGPNAMALVDSALRENGLGFGESKAKAKTASAPGATAKGMTSREVDDYIAQTPEPARAILRKLRDCIRKAVPEAEEKISYRMPAYFLNGPLVYFAAFSRHIGLYPTANGVEAFEPELAAYKHAKGSVQFPLDKPLPFALVARIVKFKVLDNTKKAATKAKGSRGGKGR